MLHKRLTKEQELAQHDAKFTTGVNTRRTKMKPSSSSPARPRDPPKTPANPDKKGAEKGKLKESENIVKILEKLDSLDNNIESTRVHLSERIDKNNEKTEQLSVDCTKVKVGNDILKTKVTVHGIRLSELEAKIEQLERDRRKTTLIIDGVEELDDEDTADIVEDVFKDIGVDYNTKVVVNLYRRGR